jgi:hypothetical protein
MRGAMSRGHCRDVYYAIEENSGEAVGDIGCADMNKDDSINLFIEKVKAERRVLKGVKREDMQVSFCSQEDEQKVC